MGPAPPPSRPWGSLRVPPWGWGSQMWGKETPKWGEAPSCGSPTGTPLWGTPRVLLWGGGDPAMGQDPPP